MKKTLITILALAGITIGSSNLKAMWIDNSAYTNEDMRIAQQMKKDKSIWNTLDVSTAYIFPSDSYRKIDFKSAKSGFQDIKAVGNMSDFTFYSRLGPKGICKAFRYGADLMFLNNGNPGFRGNTGVVKNEAGQYELTRIPPSFTLAIGPSGSLNLRPFSGLEISLDGSVMIGPYYGASKAEEPDISVYTKYGARITFGKKGLGFFIQGGKLFETQIRSMKKSEQFENDYLGIGLTLRQ